MDPAATVVALGQGAQGTDPDGDPSPMRFDLLCQEGLGNPFLWRLLASYNDVADPLRVAPGTVLAVPPGLSGATSGLTEVRAMKAATAVPSVELTLDGSVLEPAALAALASVRVARRLSLPGAVRGRLRPSRPTASPGPDVAGAAPVGSRHDRRCRR